MLSNNDLFYHLISKIEFLVQLKLLKGYKDSEYVNFSDRSYEAKMTIHIFYKLRGKSAIVIWIFNNYSPKWRWLVMAIYRAAKLGKYPSDTKVNSCFSIY